MKLAFPITIHGVDVLQDVVYAGISTVEYYETDLENK